MQVFSTHNSPLETNFIFIRLIAVVITSTPNDYNDIINVENLQRFLIYFINLEKPILVIELFLLFSNDQMFSFCTLLLKNDNKMKLEARRINICYKCLALLSLYYVFMHKRINDNMTI